jgi:MFS family permease
VVERADKGAIVRMVGRLAGLDPRCVCFTIFLLIMVPIAKRVPLTAVAIVFTITLWLRLVGAVESGWLADRLGRKTPRMI